MRILIRYVDPDAVRAPVALVERYSEKQFVEKTYRWLPHMSIAAMTFGRVSSNPQGDLIMALRERRWPNTSIAIAPPVDGFDYRRFVNLFAIPDSVGIPQFLINGRINADTCSDLAIVVGAPSFAMGVAAGTIDHRLMAPVHWVRGVTPADRQSILLVDADGDGPADIVYLDRTDGAVKAMYGRGDGRFSSPLTVLGKAGVSSIGVGQLFVGGGNALVATDRESHTLVIYRGVFRR
jgi:hypothetical protein